MTLVKTATLVATAVSGVFSLSMANANYSSCMSEDWIAKSDEAFAADCVDMAFQGNLHDRETLAWMFFTRANQLIADSNGISQSGRVPQWMAWATDDDTFSKNPSFEFSETTRDDLVPVTQKKLLAGEISMTEPNTSNEETVRNSISYEYITQTAKLNTKKGVLKYINSGHTVDMPVGTFEVKASWLKVPPGGAPEGALTFQFESGNYWWRGMHIMVKMRPLPKGEPLFYSEEPSWFWSTFEFNNNPGVDQVRENLITQRSPLSQEEYTNILEQGGISGFGFENYAPNGTQIRFTVDGKGTTPVILGHTDMEDFAGLPNTAQPSYWTSFNASCHSCHATAAINPTTKTYFPFSVPAGALTPQYYGTKDNANFYLGNGFVPLDFMWPITFHAK